MSRRGTVGLTTSIQTFDLPSLPICPIGLYLKENLLLTTRSSATSFSDISRSLLPATRARNWSSSSTCRPTVLPRWLPTACATECRGTSHSRNCVWWRPAFESSTDFRPAVRSLTFFKRRRARYFASGMAHRLRWERGQYRRLQSARPKSPSNCE